MITIRNVRTLDGEITHYTIPSSKNYEIEANGKLVLFPAAIDPHISLGRVDSESWKLAIQSIIRGGVTSVIDIPSQITTHSSKAVVEENRQRFAKLLSKLEIPITYLNYLLYSQDNLGDIGQIGLEKNDVKGVAIHFDVNSLEPLNDDWEGLFRLAAQEDLPIIINAFNENLKEFPVKNEQGASLLESALYYTEKWSNRLHVLNISTQNEIDLIKRAKKKSLLVYAETTPEHLFAQNSSKSDLLWNALNEQSIDMIGSGYNINQQNQERVVFNGSNFSLLDPIFLLPFLLTAVQEEKISIDKVVLLTSLNARDIFELPPNHDFVLIDLDKEQTVHRRKESHSTDLKLRGWPSYTICQGEVFSPPHIGYGLIHKS
jgi:dihydroorotase